MALSALYVSPVPITNYFESAFVKLGLGLSDATGVWWWSADSSADNPVWTLSVEYPTASPFYLDELVLDELTDFNWVFPATEERGVRDSWTGWRKLHEKVKRELLKVYRYAKKNHHFRHYIQLNRWWWNER